MTDPLRDSNDAASSSGMSGLPDEAIVPAELVESPTTVRRLPQPGFPLAIGVMMAALAIQLTVIVVMAGALAAFLHGAGHSPQQVASMFQDNEVYLFPVNTFSMILVAIGLAFLFYGWSTARGIAWRLCSLRQVVATALVIIPLGILASELTNVAAALLATVEPEWLRSFREQSAEAFTNLSAAPFLLVFVSACVFPGIGEEILCRGLMGRGLVARYGPWAGIFLASMLFGLMHIEPVQAFGAFVLGIGLHYILFMTRSLVAAMFAHALNNSIALTLLRYQSEFPIPGVSDLPEAGEQHVPWYLLVSALAAFVTACVLLWQSRSHWMLPGGQEWSPGYATAERPPPSTIANLVENSPKPYVVVAAWAAFLVMVTAMIVASPLL